MEQTRFSPKEPNPTTLLSCHARPLSHGKLQFELAMVPGTMGHRQFSQVVLGK